LERNSRITGKGETERKTGEGSSTMEFEELDLYVVMDLMFFVGALG
jgi:hypothetical protein